MPTQGWDARRTRAVGPLEPQAIEAILVEEAGRVAELTNGLERALPALARAPRHHLRVGLGAGRKTLGRFIAREDRDPPRLQILVSRHLADEASVREVFRHELGHYFVYLAHRKHGHGREWKHLAPVLEYVPVATHTCEGVANGRIRLAARQARGRRGRGASARLGVEKRGDADDPPAEGDEVAPFHVAGWGVFPGQEVA